MTIASVIERADELRPNPFSAERKIQWLSELDLKIAKEIYNNTQFSGYDTSKDEDKELLLEERYGDIYLFWLCAMIDFFSRDYGEYNNSIELFNSLYSQCAKDYQASGEKLSGGSDSGSGSGKRSDKYYKNIF